MSLSLILALIWLIGANVAAMLPFRKDHWPAAYVLIAIGMPLVGFVMWENGIWVGLLILVAGASMLRWPVLYFLRWIKRTAGWSGE